MRSRSDFVRPSIVRSIRAIQRPQAHCEEGASRLRRVHGRRLATFTLRGALIASHLPRDTLVCSEARAPSETTSCERPSLTHTPSAFDFEESLRRAPIIDPGARPSESSNVPCSSFPSFAIRPARRAGIRSTARIRPLPASAAGCPARAGAHSRSDSTALAPRDSLSAARVRRRSPASGEASIFGVRVCRHDGPSTSVCGNATWAPTLAAGRAGIVTGARIASSPPQLASTETRRRVAHAAGAFDRPIRATPAAPPLSRGPLGSNVGRAAPSSPRRGAHRTASIARKRAQASSRSRAPSCIKSR